jgi:hypothetical protein
MIYRSRGGILIEMNYEERIKELISKNNRLGRTNIQLIQKIKEKDETIHNQTLELRQLRNKVGELEDRLMRMYVS